MSQLARAGAPCAIGLSCAAGILPREAPLTEAHLEALLKLTRMGAIVAPPVPPFYVKPTSLDDVVREIAARTLSWLGLDPGIKMTRWGA